MLTSVNKGELVDTQILSEVHNFRIAIEALRIALNEASRFPPEVNAKSSKLEFSQISTEETSDAICAQALRSQAKKFGSLVVIVDAAKLAGLRKQWTTLVPPEVANLTDECFTHYFFGDSDTGAHADLLAKKPSIAVGAGTTTMLRATTLLKTVPIYALIKLSTLKMPASVKFGIEHLQRTAETGICKMPKNSTLNLSASAEIIRAMAYGLIALAEKTSLIAVQTSFCEIMKRQAKAIKFGPLTTFCCSMATCTVFAMYQDGIKCAAESVPSVSMVASMGRGLERMQQASVEVRQRSGAKVHEAMQSLMCNLKKIKIQG